MAPDQITGPNDSLLSVFVATVPHRVKAEYIICHAKYHKMRDCPMLARIESYIHVTNRNQLLYSSPLPTINMDTMETLQRKTGVLPIQYLGIMQKGYRLQQRTLLCSTIRVGRLKSNHTGTILKALESRLQHTLPFDTSFTVSHRSTQSSTPQRIPATISSSVQLPQPVLFQELPPDRRRVTRIIIPGYIIGDTAFPLHSSKDQEREGKPKLLGKRKAETVNGDSF